VATTRHALAALDAAAALGAGSAEERVVDQLAGLLGAVTTEEHPDRGHVEAVPDTHVVGDLAQDPVRGGRRRVEPDAEHPARLVVVRGELVAPVGDVGPLPVAVERVGLRLVERVGVDQRAAADAGTGQDDHVLQDPDPLDPEAAEPRRPEEPPGVPGGGGELVVGEAPAGLDDADPVALLGEPQRGHRPAEPRADDEDVVVVPAAGWRLGGPGGGGHLSGPF
jgi:hypothetical protein